MLQMTVKRIFIVGALSPPSGRVDGSLAEALAAGDDANVTALAGLLEAVDR